MCRLPTALGISKTENTATSGVSIIHGIREKKNCEQRCPGLHSSEWIPDPLLGFPAAARMQVNARHLHAGSEDEFQQSKTTGPSSPLVERTACAIHVCPESSLHSMLCTVCINVLLLFFHLLEIEHK